LPAFTTVNAIQADAAGSLCVAGQFYPNVPASSTTHAFVAKLSADGSQVVWWAVLYRHGHRSGFGVSGRASSTDFPGLWQTPVASRPSMQGVGFITRLSSDDATLSPTVLISGNVSANGIAVRGDGSAIAVTYGSTLVSGIATYSLAAVSLSSVGRVAAIADAAENAKFVSVAPGQLLALFGTNLAPTGPVTGFPTSVNGVTVTFNGIAALILYTSGTQINVQARTPPACNRWR
jgi:hypothetical protein